MALNNFPTRTLIQLASVDGNEQPSTLEFPEGTVVEFHSSYQQGSDPGGISTAQEIQYVNLADILNPCAVEITTGSSESTYVYNQETGEIQLIDFNEATTIDSDEVEIVTVDGNNIFTEFQTSSNSLQIVEGSRSSLQETSTSLGSGRGKKAVPVLEKSVNLLSRFKSAPALLRNSRRVAPNLEDLSLSAGHSSSPGSIKYSSNSSPGSSKPIRGRFSKPYSSKPYSRKSKIKPDLQLDNKAPQIVILEDGTDSAAQITKILESTQSLAADHSASEKQSGFVIYQNVDGDQVAEFIGDRNVIYELDSSETIFLNNVNLPCPEKKPAKTKAKPKKKGKSAKKPAKDAVSSTTSTDIPKKANKGGGASELKCMETGCSATTYNVAELRKHLTNFHDMSFDLERKEFSSDAVFKEWRQHYERDRMVSFIYRGGTKRISKVQSVTYMVCHRTGHYKPTMGDTSKRKRKMKPQGSCKIGGYCTAGIKLLRNLENGSILADICHTHYGHPLDSEAIPHLRVNPVLKKLIVKKFDEGMNLAQMLAYIHHNPDGLEGLRVLDRRAVRNMYDCWKKGLSVTPQGTISKEEVIASDKEVVASSTLVKSVRDEVAIEADAGSPEDRVVEEEQEPAPILFAINEIPEDEDEMEEDPPLLIAIDSVKSLRPDDEPSTPEKRIKVGRKSSPKMKARKRSGKPVILKTESISGNKLKEINVPSEGELEENMEEMLTSTPEKRSTNPTSSPVISSPKPDENTDDDYFESLQIRISPELEETIDQLNNHGEAGPSILLYKRIGEINTKYGGFCRAFREDDFCLIVQTPVQRQIFQLFPKIVSLEILDCPKPNRHGLKLAFLSVLDDFREAIPVAWMIADSMCTRFLSQFFRTLRYHCGELPVLYIMAPRNADILKTWTQHFSQKPKILQSEFTAKRDLRTLLNRHFPNDNVRITAWDIVDNLVTEKYLEKLKGHHTNLKKIAKRSPTGTAYFKKMDKDWLPRIKEWSFAYRVGTPANLLFAADCFLKLRKFISFKGTTKLHQSIDHILKIGYDKCFLRSKRMFKGDQKLSKKLEMVEDFHKEAVAKLRAAIVTELPGLKAWKVQVPEGEGEEEVFHLQSRCDCKIKCNVCGICTHEYMCTCQEFLKMQTMCPHVHKVHCFRNGISMESELESQQQQENEREIINEEGSSLPENINPAGTSSSEVICDSSEIAIINENVMEELNITEVLGFLGQHGEEEGEEMPKIVSITDADTQKVIYDGTTNNANALTIFQLDPD